MPDAHSHARSSPAELLGEAPWFGLLEPRLQSLILRSVSEKALATDEALVRRGDPSSHWFGITSGLLHMVLTDRDGRDTTLACVGAGEWCGEGSLLRAERRRYDATALMPCRVLLVPAEAFATLRAESLAFNHYLQGIMNDRMAGFVSLLRAGRLLSVEQRVAHCVAMLAVKTGAASGLLALGQQQIARLCGLSRQRVNAALQRLQVEGLLALEPGGVRVATPASLHAYSGIDLD